MKKHYLLAVALLPLFASGQLKQIAFAELTAGSGMYFGADMTPTTITVTLQGPADRFIAFGFGTGMASGNDALIWSTLGSGAAPLQLRDHHMVGTGVEPVVDAQQDWTVISNDVSGANRTIVASRALSTGDANDVTFNFASTTQNLFWSHGPSPDNMLQYHGAGNRASGIVRTWVSADVTPPTLSNMTPADNASGVSLTQNLILSFSEPISWGTGPITLYDENNAVVQTISSGSPGVNIVSGTFSWNPTASLVLNTDYYVQVDPTALKDAAGNFFAGFTDMTTWNFNTNDVTAPGIIINNPFVPADNASGVSVSTNLSVTFSENVQAGTGLIELFDGTNTLVESFDAAASPLITVTNAVVTINPTNDLAMNTDYYVHIAAGAIRDLSGNNYAGISNNGTWNFNTNDIGAPTAVQPFTPADNATNVSTAPACSIAFSEDIALTATGSLNLFLSNGTLVQSLAQGDPALTIAGGELQFTAVLNDLTDYYITIDPGFITDLAGNAFAGFSDPTTWSFTTGDFTPPVIAGAFSPVDNAGLISQNENLVATFSEPITAGTTGLLTLARNDGQLLTFATNSGFVSIAGNTLTVDMSTFPYEFGIHYHVLIDSAYVYDLNGNPFDGIGDSTQWDFIAQFEGIEELADVNMSWNGTLLTIETPSPVTVNLFDVSGKIVKAKLGEVTDCSDLISGVYLVGIRTKEGYHTTRIYVR